MTFDSPSLRGGVVRLGALGVAVALTTALLVGVAAPQTAAETPTYTAVNGDRCGQVTPVTGDESALRFYDYRNPFPDNPSVNTTGSAYGSEGTTDLQRANTSLAFLYADTNGTATRADDTLSVVFVHGNEGNANSTGGAASFAISGLPENGTWTVRDDQYRAPGNNDRWATNGSEARVDWTWQDGATDGGVYTGLGDEFTVTVDPAFNERAALFGRYYDGRVDRWQLLSNASGNGVERYDRTALDRNASLTISTASCQALLTNESGESAADPFATDDGAEAQTPGDENEEGIFVVEPSEESDDEGDERDDGDGDTDSDDDDGEADEDDDDSDDDDEDEDDDDEDDDEDEDDDDSDDDDDDEDDDD
ncbi:hypothetical protein [Haloarcula marina]|uniref:hypothetical protein n=1 Tax=Haloarcula marina TaxID=2961574 RepID=UPI0020B86B13|nr:hypothetical protein [Halomicroarcula marina]